MRMFERLGIVSGYEFLTDERERLAKNIYDKYVDWYKEYHHSSNGMKSFAQFLFMDLGCEAFDVFLWNRGVLVKTNDGKIGLTTGWTEASVTNHDLRVVVKTSNGACALKADEIHTAEVPYELIDYVKSEIMGLLEKQVDEGLRNRIHEKVDEAFGIK